jgi:hypothetical protein
MAESQNILTKLHDLLLYVVPQNNAVAIRGERGRPGCGSARPRAEQRRNRKSQAVRIFRCLGRTIAGRSVPPKVPGIPKPTATSLLIAPDCGATVVFVKCRRKNS